MTKPINRMMTRGLLFVLCVSVILVFAAPAHAFGPYVHRSAMAKAHETLVAEHPDVPVLWTVGNPWDNIEADLNGPQPWGQCGSRGRSSE